MRFLLLPTLLVVALAAPASAQANPQTREGFWISFGFGAGSLGCDECDDDRLNGIQVNLKMGGTLSQRLLIGGEVNGWSKTENDATLTVTSVGPVLLFYPNPSGGLFLKGGLGLATAEIDFGLADFEENGVGLTFGLGYDARVGRGFALTPYFDVLVTNYDHGSLNTVAFGLGFTWP